MIVKDLHGNNHRLNLITKTRKNSSDLHVKARKLLHSIHRSLQILEEIPVPVKKGQILYMDFFVPLLGIFVEVQGSQHYNSNTMFYKSDTDFLNQKKRDQDKRVFCEINGFTLIELKFDEEDKWEEQLKE